MTLFVVTALLLLAVDQIAKLLAVRHLTGQPDRQLVGELLQLHLTRNAGAAFSSGTGYTEVLSLIAIGAVTVIVWVSRRLGSPLWGVTLGVLMAGVASNLADRVFRAPGPLQGHVVDYLMLPNWPIFNLADVWIITAGVLILVQSFRGIKLDGSRVAPETAGDD